MRYLLGIHQPDGPAPAPELLGPIMRNLEALNEEMRSAGVWVFAVGLTAVTDAAVVHPDDDGLVVTDGPFAEGKEHLGGFTVIEARDRDAALGWARRLSAVLTLPVEVRPIQFDSRS